MTNSFKQIKNASGDDTIVLGKYHESLPEGYFDVSAKTFGIHTIFLLRGEFGHDDATIVGRIELSSPNKSTPTAYRSELLRGGEGMLFHKDGFSATLADMII